MTDEEKIELFDAGVFKRKIIERYPLNLHEDRIKLNCGHTTTILRRWTDETESECYDCRKAFEPTPAWKRSLWSRWYIGFGPFILLVIFYAVMAPGWMEEGRKRDAQKQQEWQELKDRITKLEEMVKELKAPR